MSTKRVIVIGGGLAGVCTAAALARIYDRVTVLERREPNRSDGMRLVPQAHHVHILLARGRREFDALLPGSDAELRRRGALELDFGQDFAVLWPDSKDWSPRRKAGIPLLFASRTLIDKVMQDRLRTIDTVELREGIDVKGLRAHAGQDRLRVYGVSIHDRRAGRVEELDADLVVDASGRATRAPQWFEQLGLSPVEADVVDAQMGYASRWYRRPERWPSGWWWKGVWISSDPPALNRGGVLSPTEGGRFVLSVAGAMRDYPPNDEPAFEAWLQTLRSPLIAEMVARSEPISGIYSSRLMSNRRFRYERWSERPAGFVALGESAVAMNPVSGQGMTAAAVTAKILGECARQHHADPGTLSEAFFARQARFMEAPWNIAVSNDFRFEGTIGERYDRGGLIDRYMSALTSASTNPVIGRELLHVAHMLKPPLCLLHPRVALRVLANVGLRALRPTPPPVELSPMPPLIE